MHKSKPQTWAFERVPILVEREGALPTGTLLRHYGVYLHSLIHLFRHRMYMDPTHTRIKTLMYCHMQLNATTSADQRM